MMCTLHSQPRTGNRVEPSAHRFLAEGSDKRLSTRYLRPNIQPIYQLVNALKVRRNEPEGSILAFKVRSIQKSHGWNRFWSRTLDVKDENLCHLFSFEKCSVARKEAGHWKWRRTFSQKNCAECSTRWPSAQYLRSKIQRNYQLPVSPQSGHQPPNSHIYRINAVVLPPQQI